MYVALYRKWRPETFELMLGQPHIIKILKNQISTDQISHAYLFCGTRGTGKTTTARLLAKAVNCEDEVSKRPCGKCKNCIDIQMGTHIDVIEIDAASNNGVENVREIRENVKYPPAYARYKVYIIDEVHMLTPGAFNALLKTLEEPPENVIFILATTEIHKIPATVMSRCLHLDFRRIPETDIIKRLREISDENKISIKDNALALIAANADGAMRDALSILDQCLALGKEGVSRNDIVELLGVVSEAIFSELTGYIIEKDPFKALCLLDDIIADGKDVRQFIKDWIFHFRNLMICKYSDNSENIINLSCENIDIIKKQSSKLNMEFIHFAINELYQLSEAAKWSFQPRILLETKIIKLTNIEEVNSYDALEARLAALENRASPYNGFTNYDTTVIEKNSQTNKQKEKTLLERNKDTDITKVKKIERETHNEGHSDLWQKIYYDISLEKRSFKNMLDKGVKISEQTDKEFVVIADIQSKIEFLERERILVETLAEKHSGKKLKMKCKKSEIVHENTTENDEEFDGVKDFVGSEKFKVTE